MTGLAPLASILAAFSNALVGADAADQDPGEVQNAGAGDEGRFTNVLEDLLQSKHGESLASASAEESGNSGTGKKTGMSSEDSAPPVWLGPVPGTNYLPAVPEPDPAEDSRPEQASAASDSLKEISIDSTSLIGGGGRELPGARPAEPRNNHMPASSTPCDFPCPSTTDLAPPQDTGASIPETASTGPVVGVDSQPASRTPKASRHVIGEEPNLSDLSKTQSSSDNVHKFQPAPVSGDTRSKAMPSGRQGLGSRRQTLEELSSSEERLDSKDPLLPVPTTGFVPTPGESGTPVRSSGASQTKGSADSGEPIPEPFTLPARYLCETGFPDRDRSTSREDAKTRDESGNFSEHSSPANAPQTDVGVRALPGRAVLEGKVPVAELAFQTRLLPIVPEQKLNWSKIAQGAPAHAIQPAPDSSNPARPRQIPDNPVQPESRKEQQPKPEDPVQPVSRKSEQPAPAEGPRAQEPTNYNSQPAPPQPARESTPPMAREPVGSAAHDEAPRPSEPAQVRGDAEIKPAAVRDIRLEVNGSERRVEVRLTERAGEVRVAVRTPDARLAADLRENLPALSSRLEQSGFRAEGITHHDAPSSDAQRREIQNAPENGNGDPGQGGRGNSEEQGNRERQHHRAPEETPGFKSKRKDFAWFLSTQT